MKQKIRFIFNRINERLWVRPALVCVLSIVFIFIAKALDIPADIKWIPDISTESIQSLLSIMASSMLVIATFAVGSMVSAYASVSNTATPRAFTLVVADDASQNALSTFIGAFIFSIVALIALQNSLFEQNGRFVLFSMTLLMFAVVVLTFVRWLDRIARLGRVGNTVNVVEGAAEDALLRWHKAPYFGGQASVKAIPNNMALFAKDIGYLQRIDFPELQECAGSLNIEVYLQALPGTFCTPSKPLAHLLSDDTLTPEAVQKLRSSFMIGDARTFDEDPRFGLIALSEIAARALSPAVNDPGTAIKVIGSLVRLLALCSQPKDESQLEIRYDRVFVPKMDMEDLFDDAFTSIGRGGADSVEVAVRLQKGLCALAKMGAPDMEAAAHRHARIAFQRSEQQMTVDADQEQLRAAAAFSQ